MSKHEKSPLHFMRQDELEEYDEFLRMLERGLHEVVSQPIVVGRRIAEYLLARNNNNRLLNEALISTIESDIRCNRWVFNGETLIVSDDGYLNDGQNRLTAIIRSGRTVRALMICGVPRESRMSVDLGRARRASDFLSMQDVPNGVVGASIVKLHQNYLAGCYANSGGRANLKISKTEIVAAFNRRAADYLRAISVTCNSGKQLYGFGASSVGAAYMVLRDHNPTDVDEFFSKLASGIDLQAGSPILALRNRLSNKMERLVAEEKLELILRGWNAWREGRVSEKAPPIKKSYPRLL